MDPVLVVASETLFQNLLMGLAGIVCGGLFWYGVIKNL